MAKFQLDSNLFYPLESPPKKSRLEDSPTTHEVDSVPLKSLADPSDKIKDVAETGFGSSTEMTRCSGRDSPLPLKNLGNTCYENSIIQCLFSLEMFMDKFKQSMEKLSSTIEQPDFRFRISNAFYNLYKCYNDSLKQIDSVEESQRELRQLELENRLEELKSAVGERSSQFNSTHQQDASEFFYHVIDSIQEFYQSLDKTNDYDNPVTETFELELDYMMRCPSCHHKIMSESERIRTLPLALPHVTEESSCTVAVVANSSSQEDEISRFPTPPNSDLGLDSPESHTSEEPQNDQEGKDNQALEDRPINQLANEERDSPIVTNYTLRDALNNYFKDDILESKCSQAECVSIKRNKRCLIKKLPKVLFLTLARYSHSGKKSLDEIEAPFVLSVPFQDDSTSQPTNYRLVAVVCHLGSSLDAGHYTSYVYNRNNRSWYSCDDDSISKVEEKEVMQNGSKSGYCFFYDQEPNNGLTIESSIVMTPESSPSPTVSMESNNEL